MKKDKTENEMRLEIQLLEIKRNELENKLDRGSIVDDPDYFDLLLKARKVNNKIWKKARKLSEIKVKTKKQKL